jgi:hypothetical protein
VQIKKAEGVTPLLYLVIIRRIFIISDMLAHFFVRNRASTIVLAYVIKDKAGNAIVAPYIKIDTCTVICALGYNPVLIGRKVLLTPRFQFFVCGHIFTSLPN